MNSFDYSFKSEKTTYEEGGGGGGVPILMKYMIFRTESVLKLLFLVKMVTLR